MQAQVIELYEMHETTPSMILPQHNYLFMTKTLNQRLRQTYDTTQCWLQSVSEAQLTLDHHIQQQRASADLLFGGNDSEYSPLDTQSDTSTSLMSSTQSTTSLDSSDTHDSISLPDKTSTSSQSMSILTSHVSSSPPSVISWSTSGSI
jgi:hypothetical protein